MCMHAYLPTYPPTCVHTYIHIYILTYIHTCMLRLHCIALHCIALRDIALHYITSHSLHSISQHNITHRHACPTYPSTYLHTYPHIYLPTCIHTCTHTHIHTSYTRMCAHTHTQGHAKNFARKTLAKESSYLLASLNSHGNAIDLHIVATALKKGLSRGGRNVWPVPGAESAFCPKTPKARGASGDRKALLCQMQIPKNSCADPSDR